MNFMISILGWFLWNWAELVIEQRTLDEDGNPSTNFSFRDFVAKKKYLWIGNLLCCPVILWIGAKGLTLDLLAPITGTPLGWHDLYILGSGPAFELIIFLGIRVRNIFKKKAQE